MRTNCTSQMSALVQCPIWNFDTMYVTFVNSLAASPASAILLILACMTLCIMFAFVATGD